MAAVVTWSAAGATLSNLSPSANDDMIVELAGPATKVGIDCPLGWPVAFTDFVARHQRGEVKAGEGEDIRTRKLLAYRTTDLAVHQTGGPLPLSVSTDRIGRAAMRTAGLLVALGVGVGAGDRTGSGRVVEVYPAAALKRWGYEPRRYKGKRNLASLRQMASEFFDEADWLSMDADSRTLCTTSDDAFDAVIVALNAAAAVHRGWVTEPDEQERDAARTEGWIAVPTCSLRDLDPRTGGLLASGPRA